MTFGPHAFAAAPRNAPVDSHRDIPLGRGYRYRDLHDVERLRQLDADFRSALAAADPSLSGRFEAYRAGAELPRPADGDLLIAVARHLSVFLAELFALAPARAVLRDAASREQPIFRLRDFISRRAIKKYGPGTVDAGEAAILDARMYPVLAALGHSPAEGNGPSSPDQELAVGRAVSALLDLESGLASTSAAPETLQTLRHLRAELHPDQAAGQPDAVAHDPTNDLTFLRGLLDLFERWAALHHHEPAAQKRVAGWVAFRLPHKLDYGALVPLRRPRPELREAMVAHDEHQRGRIGFQLTDPRMTAREVLAEVDYCLYCHERRKDSCSHGLTEKDGSVKRNPLGIPLKGCPLRERISEMHVLRKEGDSLAALAVVVIDNPMLPGTGHRICNDCMKACIFQKQDPVNIPQVETGVLTDVLSLRHGFEIYSLLTRWNPLNRARPYALPYNGKNVLVVGLGPAGYTLSHHLANEGFGVVAVDGLKLEPLPADLIGGDAWPPRPIPHWHEIAVPLDQRVLSGFGGVAEYGITVRWDKNFLLAIYLGLARRRNFRAYGGIRFGGTFDVEEAWAFGFHHIAIAAGAGKPTIIDVKNNLIPGVRKASDFLMALQLTGGFKQDTLANLQVRLPALVVGGGLTGIDTTTELAAYYPLQVEKFLGRWEALAAELGEDQLSQMYSGPEAEVASEFLAHGRAVRAERARAAAAGQPPELARLVAEWGGVSLVYRRIMQDSPAYRLNHEEVTKFLEEGVSFIENLVPRECEPDARGTLQAVIFERMAEGEGQMRPTGQLVRLPARTLLVAAGTSPNVIYEREHPGTFEIDARARAFRSFRAVRAPAGDPGNGDGNGNGRGGQSRFHLEPVGSGEVAFFTSYSRAGRFITHYGDNHPVYAGSVVKAMASAKDGYPHVVALFEQEIRSLVPGEQPAREDAWEAFVAGLDRDLRPTVHEVIRLTPTIVEVVVAAPAAVRRFQPGQFFRLQNYETLSPLVAGADVSGSSTRLQMEGLALTGASVDTARGLVSLIVLEMGSSSRLCARLRPGEPVVLMGPTGSPTEIPRGEAVALCGGGLGNAVLFSIARAMRESGCRVLYFAGYRKREDMYKLEEIEAATDQVIWSVDGGDLPLARRPQDHLFRGNIVEAMLAHARGDLGPQLVPLSDCSRIIAIGSDRMMAAVARARHGPLRPYLRPDHVAIASINSPMQCMMKEVCAQCLQRQIDPRTGKETFVFSCFNQDQPQDTVDWEHLRERLGQNTVQEKLSDLWTRRLMARLDDGPAGAPV
jgi:NADPH-dependent glutamate synthase beta subunit-like oxidoreductase/NAD(P)H-flavin reductase